VPMYLLPAHSKTLLNTGFIVLL